MSYFSPFSKQAGMWTEGKMAVTRILSGVDDITINGSNNKRTPKNEQKMELVSFAKIILWGKLATSCQ